MVGRSSVVAIALLALAGPSQAEKQSLDALPLAKGCTPKAAIWSSEDDGVRKIVYGTNGLIYPSDIYFEEWRDNKLAWRAKGRLECSNGASTCYAAVENQAKPTEAQTGGEPNADDVERTHAVLELIDPNDDGLSEFAVFAGLAQALYYNSGARVEWYNGFAPDEDGFPANPANIYKFMGCRASEELELLDAPRTDAEVKYTPIGRVFGEKESCEIFNETGKVQAASDTAAFWFMDDTRVWGSESHCLINSRSSDKLSLLCEGMGDEVWKEEAFFRREGDKVVFKAEEGEPLIACDTLK